MDVNAYIGGVNFVIAAGMLLLGSIFFIRLWQDEAPPNVQKVFLVAMGLAYLLLAADYVTTGVLRVEEVPVIPLYEKTPTAILLLLAWRTLLATCLWTLIFYVVVFKRGGPANPE